MNYYTILSIARIPSFLYYLDANTVLKLAKFSFGTIMPDRSYQYEHRNYIEPDKDGFYQVEGKFKLAAKKGRDYVYTPETRMYSPDAIEVASYDILKGFAVNKAIDFIVAFQDPKFFVNSKGLFRFITGKFEDKSFASYLHHKLEKNLLDNPISDFLISGLILDPLRSIESVLGVAYQGGSFLLTGEYADPKIFEWNSQEL